MTDAKGTRVARVSGEELVPGRAADPWDAVNGTVLNTIAGKTTSQLAASLPHGSATPVAVSEGKPHRHRLCGAATGSRAAAGQWRARSSRSGRAR